MGKQASRAKSASRQVAPSSSPRRSLRDRAPPSLSNDNYTMADVVRFTEAISSLVLDAGEAVSYRSLASQVGGESAARAQALAQFYEQNGTGVGAMHVSVERNASTIKTTKKVDPRARVVRLSVASEPVAQVYGVYPSTLDAGNDADDNTVEAMALALWAQERKVRNDLFAKTSKHQPLSRELKAFYQSDVHCAEATSRMDVGDNQGEEAVTVFDTIKTSTNGRTQTSAASTSAKPSFFKGAASTSTSANGATSSSSSVAKSNSFFKSSSTAASTKAKTSAPAAKSKAPTPAEAKRIDAGSMNNVLTVDSDDDSDADDDDAPKFVKSAPAAKPRSKRVMISDDDEDEDDDVEGVAAPPAKKETRPSAKRKLSESPERPAKQAKAASPKKAESPKRKREVEVEEQDEEPQAEEDPVATGPIKRRQQVTKTVINDMGYMVTEKVWEEVEVSVEELAKERAEAKKKQAAAQAAAAAQKARAAAAEKAAANKASKAAAGPPKQKKLDFFFARK